MSQQATLDPMEPLDPLDESRMTLMEHLIELRLRLMWVVGAMLIGTIVSMAFASQLIEFLQAPLEVYEETLIAISPTDTIIMFFKVSFTVGTIIAMPVIVYQIIAFVAPGLYPHEKRIVLLMLPGVMVLFACGALFAYFVLLPVAIGFLQNFLSGQVDQEWTIDRYIGFITRIIFWIGVAFEMPLVVSALARIGLVSGKALRNFWRQAIVIIALVAAIITPTVDPVNMAIVMAPLGVLYGLSVALAYMLYVPRTPRDFTEDMGEEE